MLKARISSQGKQWLHNGNIIRAPPDRETKLRLGGWGEWMKSGKEWYREQLKDPRWQKKRLEVFMRDNFSCVKCKDETTELHVDHLYYVKGASPWEVPMDALQALCRPCHEIKSEMDGIIKVSIPQPQTRYYGHRAGQCQEAFLMAYWNEKSALKENAMRILSTGRLRAGSVARIFQSRGLSEA